MNKFKRYVELRRKTINRLNPETLKKKLKGIAGAAERNRSFGFQARVGRLEEPHQIIDLETKTEKWQYVAKIQVVKETVRNEDATAKQFKHILNVLGRKAESEGWEVLGEEKAAEQESNIAELLVPEEPRTPFQVPELDQDAIDTFFHGIYERDEQIRTIHAAVEMSVVTDGEILPHVLLYGRPGSCKTVLMERFKAWYDSTSPGFERVAFVDGTTMTKAGLERWLLEMATDDCLPSVLVLDEIEKQEKDNLLSLLSIMGSGIIARLNAIMGNRREKAKFVIVGICNDEKVLRDWRDGALWSRFGGNRLPCVRPSKELCQRILYEMVCKIPGGKTEWADAALQFGWERLGQRDIREIKDHLCGRDRLLTGEWQDDRIRMIEAKQLEEQQETTRERISAGCSEFPLTPDSTAMPFQLGTAFANQA